nr:RhuM family protein [Virgibacillus doumboii]
MANRAKAEKENMGLTSWRGDKVRKQDITVAKNYLSEKELKSLNRIVTMYLDYAEDQAERQRPMYMKDWISKMNAFLQFNEREILENAGKISKTIADKIAIATQEYEKFNQNWIQQNSNDDFEKFIESKDLRSDHFTLSKKRSSLLKL